MIYQSEIDSYKDLENYIRHQLALQTEGGKRRAQIKLNETWFYKLHKLIQFALKYSEPTSQLELKDACVGYWVRINGVLTLVERYDLRGKENNKA